MLKVKNPKGRQAKTSPPSPSTLAELRIVPMPPHLEPDVREIHRVCHPKWPEPPEPYYFATPTLVAIAPYPGNVVGFASYALNLTDQGHTQIWLKDTCVLPEYQGKGIAKALMRERLKIGQQMGASVALGMTQPENVAMLALLRSLHFDEREHFPRAYPAGEDGIFFGLSLSSYREGV